MELQLEELEAAASRGRGRRRDRPRQQPRQVRAFSRKKPARQPFPEHLPRERRHPVRARPPARAAARRRLAKLGEDVTETLEVVPRQWKVIQHVREKFTCRACETITQPPAPFHVMPRGCAGPSLLAMILFEKYGQHLPLNRQSGALCARGRRSRSSPRWPTRSAAARRPAAPLYELIRAHVFAGRAHARR